MESNFNLDDYKGKKVKLVLSNGYVYYGVPISIGENYLKLLSDNGFTFIVLKEISVIEVKDEI